MCSRRRFLGTIPLSAVAISTVGFGQDGLTAEVEKSKEETGALIVSPPVVQNPREDSFGVSIAVSGLATAWVEYGFSRDDLKFTATASHHGLIAADDTALHVRVHHDQPFPVGQPIYYRVVAQPLAYKNAYSLQRGDESATEVHALKLPSAEQDSVRIVSINDTHENLETIRLLHQRIAELNPDVLIWNGDTCNDFDNKDAPAQILLNPAKDLGASWASSRPLLFSNGNHDIRGERAREAIKSVAGCPESIELPYNQVLRVGNVAVVTLDTGEDKPDAHPVFAGTAAYEPYRERQAKWLRHVADDPTLTDAAFKIAICHIPLRGLPGQNDGMTLEGYAGFSGFGARAWLPQLRESEFQAILSGHTHQARLDDPTPEMPVLQFVGGGPRPDQATVTVIDAKRTPTETMSIRIMDLNQNVLHRHDWS